MNRLAIRIHWTSHRGDGVDEAISDLVSNDQKLKAVAATSWGTIAEQAIRRGDWEFATDSAENSVELLRILCTDEDAQPDLLCDYARALTLKGELDIERDQVASAKLAFAQAKATYEKLLQLAPHDPLFLRGLGVTCDKLGDMSRAANDLDVALDAYQQALTVFRQAAHVDSEFLRDLSLCLSKLGELNLMREDVLAARHALEEHLTLSTKIANSDVTKLEPLFDVADAHRRMAQLAGSIGDDRDELKHSEAAHKIVETIASSDRLNFRWQQDLTGSLFNMGMLLTQTGDIGRGTKMVNQSYNMLKEMNEVDQASAAPVSERRSLVEMMLTRLFDSSKDLPLDSELQRTVASVQLLGADLARAQGDWERAGQLTEEALLTFERLAQSNT